MSTEPRHVVIFDFDETMVLENSLSFLFKQLSRPSYWVYAVPAVAQSLIKFNFGYKLRRAVKKSLYLKFLTGVTENKVRMAGCEVAMMLTKNEPIMNRLLESVKNGDAVIVATASPQIYVDAILSSMGIRVDMVIGTKIDLDKGIIIGEECSRDAKWVAVREALKNFNCISTTGFGNSPDDEYMLEQVDRGFIVSGKNIVQHNTV